ncbi:MAG: LysR family transcriptional regulator [Alphaproteobacteria bacterium]|nr:LysR family transcriptional regulator [Alphaproteobacteria bacterium]
MNLNDLETFILVVESGTFSGAAEQLGVPKSTVSRRVARLEEELGVALLRRASRSFEVSDDGQALYARCAPALREIAGVERDLVDSEAEPQGLLRLSTSIDFGGTETLARLLADYGARHPGVRVDLQITNRVVDLLEENIDLAFRTHEGPLPSREDLVARRIAEVRIGVYASPDYLARAGRPKGIGSLKAHATGAHARAFLAAWPVTPRFTVNDYGPLAALLAAGAGVGMLPDFVAAPYLRAGRLERVLPDWGPPPSTLSLVWLRSRHLAPRVRAFIDLAVSQAKESRLEAP